MSEKTSHDDLTDFLESVDSLAVVNATAQEALTEGLHNAFLKSGRSLEDVADQLRVAPEIVEAALRGVRDLTLTEIRLLALAVNAFVRYQVTPVSASQEASFPKEWTAGLWHDSPFDAAPVRRAARG